ncbi:MAG: sulfite exporter TauE/SafE family protein [Bacteroidetes bacterium]|nr:sulfite exporter TauE/SafE family protein [Bacteroidota bacterium]
MSILVFTLIILVGAFIAGLLGSLTGLGGGVVIIPLLTLGFNIDIRYAIGTSLVAIIANSSGAAAAYIKEGITNIRLGMFLEIATTIGAVAGAMIAVYFPTHWVAILFGLVLLVTAALQLRKKEDHLEVANGDTLAGKLRLNSSYPTSEGEVHYSVRRVPGGFLLMLLAGMMSALLGIGAGAFKVLGMDHIMHVPFKVSTTTSNFMIGVTAAASSVVYFQRGYIDPGLCFPVVIGVLLGATLGSRILLRSATGTLRMIFSIVISILAAEMIYKGIKTGF